MGRIYDLQRWRRKGGVRDQHLAREPLCRHCQQRGLVVAAVDVDHILAIEAGGDPWDHDNMQSLCHQCHSRKTGVDEGKNVRHGCDARGLPVDPRHHWNASTGSAAPRRGKG
jgi:5-methylcytosine-specific restriction protein A